MVKNKIKITFVTVSRSDFGIMKNIIKKGSEVKTIETSFIITGTFSKIWQNNKRYRKRKIY